MTYAYGDSSWGDLLTAFDGNAITYDAIGNPLSDGTWTYTWQHGRQLAGMYGEGIGGGDNEVTITYTYDANGMRVGKTVTTKTYETIVTHTHSYTATTVAATCTTGGYTTYTCECGDSYQGNETAALGHSYTGSVVESTCTGEGYTVYTCSACGDTYQDNQTPALGHSYTETVVAPTCTEQGYTAHTCSVCGYSYHSDETAALGHDYTVQTNNKLNKRTYTCVRCGYSYTEPILGKPVDIIEPIVPVVPNPPVEVASTGAGGITATAAYVVADTAGTNTTERVLVSTEVQTYTYVYNGGSLMQETITTTVTTDDGTTTTAQTLDFAYDASGLPMSVTCNGETYYYVTNLQGDVTDILDDAGTALVTYTYDAWGNILTTTGSLASTLGIANPLCYRSYVYDAETGLYYLQSRYYNPEIGRFISADSQLSTDDVIGLNLFAYCGNNPVNRVDPTGKDWWHWVVAAGIVAAAAAAVVLTAGGAAAALTAVTLVANGIAVSSTATTVAAGVLIGSATALGVSAYAAMLDSSSADDFANYGETALISTVIGGAVGGVMANSLPGHACFIAGTLVKSEHGDVPIESIRAGDMVWAWDEATGDIALKEVVETYKNETSELIHVYVNGEEIITTPTHPFYSPVKGWTAACKLRAGDILVLVNGEYVVVEKVQHEILESPVKVYNFQVEDYHTYFVSKAAVLVHNKCVAREGNYRADVRVGGDPNHARGHAHIYEGTSNIASIDVNGEVLAGKLTAGAAKFVNNYLSQIAQGIIEFYYKG